MWRATCAAARGSTPEEQQEDRARRNRRQKIFELVSIYNGASFQLNHAGGAAPIHTANVYKDKDVEVQTARKEELARKIREREAQLSAEVPAATLQDLLRPDSNDVGDEEVCMECSQHFNDDGDIRRCKGWHHDCTDDPECDDIETVRARWHDKRMAVLSYPCEFSMIER